MAQIDFKTYLDAIEHGASRSRIMVQTLMFGTFLTVLALYNSLDANWNWLASRETSHHIAAEWVRFAPDTNSADTIFLFGEGRVVDTLVNRFTVGQFFALTERDKIRPFEIDSVNNILESQWARNILLKFPAHYVRDTTIGNTTREPKGRQVRAVVWENISRAELSSAIRRLSNFQCHNEGELQWLLTNLKKAHIDNALLIEMPFLGISFDVNSLALISGLAFSIIYFLLYFSLSREQKNITLLFKIHRERGIHSRDIYQLLSMYQVLTVPRSIDRFIVNKPIDINADLDVLRRDKNRYLRWIPMVPVVLPVGVWLTVFIYDWKSSNAGIVTNEALTHKHYLMAGAVGILVLYSVYRCLQAWVCINDQWDAKAEEVVRDLMEEGMNNEGSIE